MNKDYVSYVNHLMAEIHELTSAMYEDLMDEDHEALNSTLDNLIEQINLLKENIQDE